VSGFIETYLVGVAIIFILSLFHLVTRRVTRKRFGEWFTMLALLSLVWLMIASTVKIAKMIIIHI